MILNRMVSKKSNNTNIWTGTFICEVCKTEYHESKYTTKNGKVCNFGCQKIQLNDD